MTTYLFVGERPSATAFARGYTWADGRLAGKTLGDALDHLRIPESERGFINLFGDRPDAELGASAERSRRLARIRRLGKRATVVGMGGKVCRVLADEGISHVAIVHPAARGTIRRKDTYIAHVAEALGHPGLS
jgi:hypothetical protein